MKKILVLGATLLLSLAMIGCGKQEVKTSDLLNVSEMGLDKEGTFDVSVNRDPIVDALILSGDVENEFEAELKADMVIEYINFEASKTEGLSNGDVVDITLDANKKFLAENKIKLVGDTKFEHEMTELIVPEIVDMFVNYDFEEACNNGTKSPYIIVSGQMAQNFGDYNAEFFIKDSKGYYSNGDKVIIEMNYSAPREIQAKETEKEYAIEGFDYYIRSFDEISEGDLKYFVDEMTTGLVTYINGMNSFYSDITEETFASAKPVEMWISSENELSSYEPDYSAMATIIYEVTLKDDTIYYVSMDCKNLYADGKTNKIQLSQDIIQAYVGNNRYEETLEAMKEDVTSHCTWLFGEDAAIETKTLE